MQSTLNMLLKKSNLDESGSFLEARRAAVLLRALRIFAPREGQIYLNTFEGQALKRAGYVIRNYDFQHLVVRHNDGGPGYHLNLAALHKALRR